MSDQHDSPASVASRREEMAVKLRLLRSWLERHSLEGVLIGSQAGFAWVTAGGESHVSLAQEAGAASVLVTVYDAFLLCANIELARFGDEQVAGLGLTLEEWPWHEPEGGRALLERLCRPDRVVSDLGAQGLAPAPPDLARLRRTLLPSEVGRYRHLGADAAEAVETACRAVRPGDSELDVAARVASECRRRDILALVNLVGGDGRIDRYRHPLPTTHRVERVLLVALTGRRHGLHASLTRIVAFGPPDAERAARHRAVARVDARMLLESRPGATLAEVLAAGIEQYEREGFPGQWRLHHQGGLTGYAGREVFATPSADHRLQTAQAVAWNPSITGTKSEDTALVTDAGPQLLTRSPDWPRVTVELPQGAVDRPILLSGG
ncbi:MAG TPA: M24 family metallopeptidase [Acidimicrobiales bacterium]|nr:M24 family metallopeptidase [Acidimicrobiales bacterium]